MASGKNAAFRAKVAKFARAVEQNPEKAVRAIGLSVLRELVQRSPVDTGRFRGNWFVQFDAQPQQTADTDKSGGASVARGLGKLGQFKLGMPSVFLLNHLPYSHRLEYGHSQQAPQGVVRLTVARFDEILRGVKAEMRK